MKIILIAFDKRLETTKIAPSVKTLQAHPD